MGQLIDDLLAFSRVGRTELLSTEIDMNRLVKKVILENTSKEERDRVKISISDLPPTRGDSTTITQVIINLVSNALKYSSLKETPEIEIGFERLENEIIYFVKDNGVGFDMQFYPKLFGVFQRLHSSKEFEGNGVGLAIVQRIIQRHGGRVWAKAEVGKGAEFYFALPDDFSGMEFTN